MDTPEIQITTWNVLNEAYENESYYHRDAYPYLHWTQGRSGKASHYLSRLKSDIYSLQEVSLAMSNQILETLGHEYSLLWQPRTQQNDSKTEDGCATIYRNEYKLERYFVYRYHSGKHIFLASLFSLNEKKSFWVVNTHINWSTHEDDLMDLQKQVNTHKDFTLDSKIIMGDFNAESNETWYTYLERYHLTDAFRGHEGKYSYNSGKSAKWIDFMLLHNLAHDRITKRIIGNDPNIIHNFEDTTLPSEKIPSDHLPLSLRIILE